MELKQMEYERNSAQRAKEEVDRDKKKRKLFRNHFKIKKEQQESVKKMTRKDKRELQKEMDRLGKLSQRELQAHLMIKDPNNPFMRKLTLEGT